MDATTRWAALMQRPEGDLRLDEAALTISAHATPGLDVDAQLHRLDEIAARVGGGGTDGLCTVLFGDIGLQGDRADYDDPRNSYLDQVLDRGKGIPITLSVLLIEIGRRCGLSLEGVGMPGHFLVRDVAAPMLLIDAFDGGARLDHPACERLLRQVTGPRTELTPSMLAATGPWAILARMLANLDRSFERRADRGGLQWVSALRLGLPGLPVGDRMQLASRLGALGRFDAAADLFDAVADGQDAADVVTRLRSEATSMRARLN